MGYKKVKKEIEIPGPIKIKLGKPAKPEENLAPIPGGDEFSNFPVFLKLLLEIADDPNSIEGLDVKVRNMITLLQQPAIVREAQILLTSTSEKNVLEAAKDILNRAGQTAPIKIENVNPFGDIPVIDVREKLKELLALNVTPARTDTDS